MLIKSAIATQMSGSLGGLTASHNRGGMYFRARTIPTNPSSTGQTIMRNLLGFLSSNWAALTEDKRTAWTLYGENVPVVNPLGASINLSGQQWYVACNCARARAGLATITNGPTTFALANMSLPTLNSADSTADEIDVAFENADDWANQTGGGLIIQVGRPQGAGINSFKGPWRFAGKVNGDDSTPPTSPATISSPFVLTTGQKVWIRATASTADGRISAASILGPVVAAAP